MISCMALINSTGQRDAGSERDVVRLVPPAQGGCASILRAAARRGACSLVLIARRLLDVGELESNAVALGRQAHAEKGRCPLDVFWAFGGCGPRGSLPCLDSAAERGSIGPTLTVLLLRHAKSNWDTLSLPDYDRPLAKRGRKAAPLMGAAIARLDLKPDLIVRASGAARTRETLAPGASRTRHAGARGHSTTTPSTWRHRRRSIDAAAQAARRREA